MEIVNSKDSGKELEKFEDATNLAIRIDKLLNSGRNWVELTTELNQFEQTYKPIKYYQHIHLKYFPVELDVVDEKEFEKQRAVQELDWIIEQATLAYRKSLEDRVDSIQTAGYVRNTKGKEVDDDEDSLSKNKGNMVTVNKLTGKADNTYLNTIMNAIDKKCKILGINAPKKTEFDLGEFFKNLTQVNIQNNINYTKPVTSEKDALKMGSLINSDFEEIEEDIDGV